VAIFGNALQQSAQQEATRSRHGSSFSQTTQAEGRTIRSASRPRFDNALTSLACMRTL
jgi:hypothetical protein